MYHQLDYPALDVVDIKQYLRRPQVFDHEVDEIEFIETNISLLCLTGSTVYKVKKAVEMGDIIDFTDLTCRKYYCNKEVELNRRFSSDIYEGVVVLTEAGITDLADLTDDDIVLEYAVRMQQLPQSCLLRNRLEEDAQLDQAVLDSMVDTLVAFYNSTESQPQAGDFDHLTDKLDDNFATLESMGWSDNSYKSLVYAFLDEHWDLFARRIRQDRIVDGHGDLRPKNIFVVDNEIKIFDCIEFNDLLRYVDIAEDIGYLLMELDKLGMQEEVLYLIGEFTDKLEDDTLPQILPFYQSYRAAVRTKINLFAIEEIDQSRQADIRSRKKLAREYHKLARSYMEEIT